MHSYEQLKRSTFFGNEDSNNQKKTKITFVV